MLHDRTYWRAQDDTRLIDEAKHYPSVELCIALAERLEDANVEELEERIADMEIANRDLERLVSDQQTHIEVLDAQIDGMIYPEDD